MKKKILACLLAIITIFSVAGCNKGADKTSINIASMKGPTSIGLAKLYDRSDLKECANSYNYSIHGSADAITAGLIKGDIDIAALPCNVAASLYHKTEGEILIAGINTLGVLYVVEKGDTVNSVTDLQDQTIFSTGQGTTPEFTFNHILSMNNTQAIVSYSSEATEVISALTNLDSAIAVLPEPYVTIAMNTIPDLRVCLDLTKEWEDISENSTMVTGVIVIRKEFAEQNPDAIEKFFNDYDSSIEYIGENTAGIAALLGTLDIMKEDIAREAIPNCNVVLITGDEMETKVTSYLNVLYEANPESVGGKAPESGMFYK